MTNTIVGPVRGSVDQALAVARSAGAQRIDQVELYLREIYRLGPEIGFDPAILVAQSALETNYWRSSWWVLRLNPAGIGVTGDPAQNSASPTFANGTPREGAGGWWAVWNKQVLQDYRGFGVVHRSACNLAFADGSVKSIADKNRDGYLNNGFGAIGGFADSEPDIVAGEVHSAFAIQVKKF